MITARKLCLQLWVQPRQRSLYVIRSQVVFPTFTCRRKKDHSSRRFLLILGMGALLSAVSAGVTVSAVILYHLGIIFGVFLPCKPVKKSFGIADRVRGSPPCSVWVRVHLGTVFIAPVPAFSQACVPGVKSGRYCP